MILGEFDWRTNRPECSLHDYAAKKALYRAYIARLRCTRHLARDTTHIRRFVHSDMQRSNAGTCYIREKRNGLVLGGIVKAMRLVV